MTNVSEIAKEPSPFTKDVGHYRFPTRSEMKILEQLETGPRRQVEVMRAAGISYQGIGQLVHRLLTWGFIEYRPERPLIGLTEIGRRTLLLWNFIKESKRA